MALVVVGRGLWAGAVVVSAVVAGAPDDAIVAALWAACCRALCCRALWCEERGFALLLELAVLLLKQRFLFVRVGGLVPVGSVVVVGDGGCRLGRLLGDPPHGLDVGLCLFCRCEQDKGSRRALQGRCRRDRPFAAIFPIFLLGRACPFGARPRRTTSISYIG